MLSRLRKLVLLLASALLACSLAGCGTINEKLSATMDDYIPQWAGGLPADAPPRPGTAQYDEWMKERERQRLLPADQRDKAPDPATTSSTPSAPSSAAAAPMPGLGPVH